MTAMTSLDAMEKSPKSKSELEDLLMLDLRGQKGCEKALRIVVIAFVDDDDSSANWTVSRFDPGHSDADACDRALQHIVPRFQRVYELVQKH